VTEPRAAGRETLDPEHPLFGLGYAQPVATRTFVRLDDGRASEANAPVAEEVPLALVYNGTPHVVMMGTPADVEDFAVGFSVTEEIVGSAAEIASVRAVKYSQGIEVAIAIPPEREAALGSRGRSLVGRTGCGLCGVTTIDDALRPGHHVGAAPPVTVDAVFRAVAALPAHQRYNEGTNAVHSAAWAGRDGTLALVREDVGRHNALDKLIGAMLRAGLVPSDGFAVVTSRASYELIQKCAAVGITTLAAISRPTGLAVRMAEAAGITLLGLVRGRSANVYAHPEALGR
jgi:formate dehydrogenase accessory protein FdhD